MRWAATLLVIAPIAVACAGGDDVAVDPSTSRAATAEAPRATAGPSTTTVASTPAAAVQASIDVNGTFVVPVDLAAAGAPVSPAIRGLTGAPAPYLAAVGATVNSWGGNATSRYNYASGHAWNAGRDGAYANANVGGEGDAARAFLGATEAGGAAARLTVPTLGWVAADDDPSRCSFPASDGGCTDGGGATCSTPGPMQESARTSVASSPPLVAAWVRGLVEAGLAPAYVAMDHEPELWGVTHYDVHPACTTYQEILDKYTAYADALRDLVPSAKFAGPVMCCWYSFWLTSPGPPDDGPADFLTWFLARMSAHDREVGRRTLDVLDVHYYPQSDVLNDDADAETAALRLRSTRSLWDASYTDESWVHSTIQLIPRLREAIAQHYPGTELGISAWNFGADQTMNGALAIADVLGIYGREGVSMAAYAPYPPAGSPGYFAFAMHGNYDGAGASFEGASIGVPSPDVDRIATFAASDSDAKLLKVMVLNKQPDSPATVRLAVAGGEPAVGRAFAYAGGTSIDAHPVALDGADVTIDLPPASIVVLELDLG